jgi:hypothetical protein
MKNSYASIAERVRRGSGAEANKNPLDPVRDLKNAEYFINQISNHPLYNI